MKKNLRLPAILIFAAMATIAPAQEEIPDVFADPAIDFDRPADRARAVERIRAIEQANLERARAKAQAMGVPMRRELPGGGATEIMGLDENGEFIIHTTHNVNAAISTAANLVQTSPYNLNGSGITVGVWDGGGVRTTHQEFATGSRATIIDGGTLNDHATHVAGTIAAAGVSPNARGMAIQARIDSYEWTSDTSEMLGRGATAPGQADKIYVSNHSYGYVEGWDGNTWRGTGTDQNAYDPQFGQYSAEARTWDDTVFKSPYYLPFKSAGNDNSNNPAAGSQVVIGGVTLTYDPAIHPKGDGLYRNATTNSANGYENIGSNGTAKNIMTVGAANDAVTSGQRDPSKSTITGFSSRGPTDDGRIKPDIVANGADLYSPVSGSNNTSYGNYSGTSMSSPNAAGSAALLVQHYANLFNGGAMRASTLKGLIIHTATDIGNPGPDYHYGWGLMNTKEAADLVTDHHAHPSKQRLIEDRVTSSAATRTYSFLWDGSSALRATLCWTDPPGTSTTSHDLRTPRLVNNLNLRLIAPNGSEYFPYVMPFVGTWTLASMSQNAITGVNNTDNVEQVRIASPGQTGAWQAVVSYTGALTNNLQNFSLLFSGVSDGIIPLTLNSITPNSGTVGSTVTTDITGTALSTETSIRLRQAGRPDIIGSSLQMLDATTLRCQFNLTGAASGSWNLVAINPDTETFTLPDAFTTSGTLTTIPVENFDALANGAPSNGWSSTTSTGTNSWTVVSSPTHPSHTPTKSCYVTGPANNSVTYLTSSPIAIPSGAANLQIQFWHQHNINTRHGGRFSMSIDNGPWFDVTDAGSGAAFTSNGYNATVVGTGQTSAFANLPAWTGSSNGFIRTTVSFNDIPKYAGKNLRLRWGIATNSNQTSAHWYVDSIALTSDSSTPNQPPLITTAASTDSTETLVDGSTTYQILRGTGTDLSVTASDDAGAAELTYTWQTTGPAPVTYSLNGNNAAKNTTATFNAAGDYAITVTVMDGGGLAATSTVNVRILNTSTFTVAPESAILGIGGTRQFTATLINQFGAPDANQPSPVNWTASGGGTISSGGFYTATGAGGPYLITATSGTFTDTSEVTVNRTQAGIELQDLNRTYSGLAQVVTAVTSPPGLSYSVTYDGQTTAPSAGGSYDVVASITDPNHEGTTSGTLVISYKVSYQGNGNTSGNVPAEQTKFHDVDLTLAPNSGNLNKTDFSFAGWNTTPEGNGTTYAAGSTYNGNTSLTLYARWTPGADGTWIQTSAGPFDWATSENWSGGTIASGTGRTANFTADITADQIINLETPRTIGNINFTDSTTASHDLTIAGASILTLASTSDTPVINVTNRTLTVSSRISGNNGLRKSGVGILVLDNAANNYTGETIINSGVLQAGHSTAMGNSTVVRFNGDAEIRTAHGANPTFTQGVAVDSGVAAHLNAISQDHHMTFAGMVSGGGTLLVGGTDDGDGNITLANTGNTHTGIIRIGKMEHAGNLFASSIADGSGAIELGGTTGAGNLTFQNTGSALTFNSRQVVLAGTSGGGAISNNGATPNTVTFTQDLLITGTGNKTLDLGGSNNGANLFSGNIADGAGSAISLAKSGTGAWALGGNNTYSGTTIVSAGKLLIHGNQSLATGAVSVAAAATLGGTGTIGGNITILPGGQLEFDLSTNAENHNSLELSAGRTLDFSGSSTLTITSSGDAYPGTYTLITGGSPITGSAPSALILPSGWAATVSIASNSLLLHVTSTGGGPGPVDHFVISPIASPQTVGTPITGITITARDGSGNTATSFTGTVNFAGTAGITGTSANFVDGVLSDVSVTPTATGSNLTFTVDDGAGHSGSAFLNVQTVFQSWASAQGLAGENALPGANPDNDISNNLLEFAFGTDPNTPSAGQIAYSDGMVTARGQPLLVEVGGIRHAVFARRANHASAGLNYAVRFSADLESGYWEASSAVPTILATDGVIEAVAVPYPETAPSAVGPKTARFFQVRVTGN